MRFLSIVLLLFVLDDDLRVRFAAQAALAYPDGTQPSLNDAAPGGTLNGLVPATRPALAGRVALASLELIPTVSVIVLIRFQLASTALTVTLNGVPFVTLAAALTLNLAVTFAVHTARDSQH